MISSSYGYEAHAHTQEQGMDLDMFVDSLSADSFQALLEVCLDCVKREKGGVRLNYAEKQLAKSIDWWR
jgi:hypothetical protein